MRRAIRTRRARGKSRRTETIEVNAALARVLPMAASGAWPAIRGSRECRMHPERHAQPKSLELYRVLTSRGLRHHQIKNHDERDKSRDAKQHPDALIFPILIRQCCGTHRYRFARKITQSHLDPHDR